MESPCECGIELPGSINHRVNYLIPAGNIPLRRPSRRWEDNIRRDLKEIGVNTWNWVDSAEDTEYWRALVNAALNLRVP